MQKKFWIRVALLLMVPAFLLLTVSCAQQTVQTEEPVAEEEVAVVEEETPAAAETEVVEEEAPAMMESDDSAMEAAQNMFLNEHVYFAFDQSSLDSIAQETLRVKAEYMSDNPSIYVTIEGHCDERGTAEYNLALGDRRAQSVKNFLVDLGVDATRLSTVSYGEERPVDPASSEEAWAKNRRAQFRIE